MRKIKISLALMIIAVMPALAETFEQINWSEQNGINGQYYNTGYSRSKPLVYDFDNDGDKDVLLGSYLGYLSYFRNNDINTNTGGEDSVLDGREFELVKKIFLSIPGEYGLSAEVGDLNGDGFVDLVVGCTSGKLYYIENLGTLTDNTPDFSDPVYMWISYDGAAAPALNDVDNDRDLDLFIGTSKGSLYFLRNGGDATSYSFTLENEDLLETRNLYTFLSPRFCDIDGDGDDELMCGRKNKTVLFFEKTVEGGSFTFTLTTETFGSVRVEDYVTIFFSDIDGDNDFDLFTGDDFGSIRFYENTGSSSSYSYRLGSYHFLYFDLGSDVGPLFFDMDGDNDTDLLLAHGSDIAFFKNGTSDIESFSWSIVSNSLVSTTYSSLRFDVWDYDLDGDDDLFFGNITGGVGLLENTPSDVSPYPVFKQIFEGRGTAPATNFDSMRSMNMRSSPIFVDVDGDGDRDCVIVSEYGFSAYYRNDDVDINQGGEDDTLDGWSSGDFTLVKAANTSYDSYFPFVIGGRANGDSWDVDGDGDYDFLFSTRNGNVILVENIGTPTNAEYIISTKTYGNIVFDENDNEDAFSVLNLDDFNHDGWFDIILGGGLGGIKIWKNMEEDDILPPSTPQNFSANAIRHDIVKLSWDRSDDSAGGQVVGTGVDYYVIKRDSVEIARLYTPCPLVYYDRGLTQETLYNYDIYAVDKVGLESSPATLEVATGLPAYLVEFYITTPTALENASFQMTVEARDNYGLRYDLFNDAINLVPSEGTISPTSVTLVNGIKTFDVTFSNPDATAEVILTIDVSDAQGSVTDTSDEIHLDIIKPTTPVLNSATALDENNIRLTWDYISDGGGAPNYYVDVYRDGSRIKILDGGDTYYIDNSCLAETTYTYKLRARDSLGNTTVFSNEMSATTPAPTIDNDPPSTPTGLRIAASGQDFLAISWNPSTDSGGSGVKGYQIFRGEGYSAPEYIAFTSGTYFTDDGLTPSTDYTYFVKSEDNSDNVSGYSQGVTGTTDDEDVPVDNTPPTTPTNLTVDGVSNTEIFLDWSSSTDYGGTGVSGYQVFRSDYMNYSVPLAVVTTSYYSDEGLTQNTTYTYKVKAFDNAGNYSVFSTEASGSTLNIDLVSPTIPTNLQGTVIDPETIDLTWDPSEDDVQLARYDVYQIIAGGSFGAYELIGDTTETQFSVNGLEPGKTYQFSIKAVDAADNESGFSDILTITTETYEDDLIPPYPPENLRFTLVNYEKVTIEFDAAEDDAEGSGVQQYRIYRNDVEVSVQTETFYEDTSVVQNNEYTYFVKSEDFNSNLSEASASITTEIPEADFEAPTTPTNLTAEANSEQVVLNWNMSYDTISGVETYEIFKSIDSNIFKTLNKDADFSTRFTTYTDTEVVPGYDYIYRVRAVDKAGNISSFAEVSVTVPEESDDDYTVYFPHIDSSWIWWTGFTLVNVADTAANVSFKFYSSDGVELVTLEEPSILLPGEKMVSDISSLFDGDVPEGVSWFKVESDQKLEGFELFGTTDGEEIVGVKISDEGANKLLFPSIIVDEDQWTGIAVINIGSSTGSVVFKAYDDSGSLLGTSDSFTVNSNGKLVSTAWELFPGEELPAGTRVLKAEADFSMIGFELFGYFTQDGIAGLSGVALNDENQYYKSDSIVTEATDSPQNISVFLISSTTVEVSWDAPLSGPADSYRVYTATTTISIFGNVIIHLEDLLGETASTSVEIDGLEPETEYTIIVVSVRDGEELLGDTDDLVTFTTGSVSTVEKYVYMIPRLEEKMGGTSEISLINKGSQQSDIAIEALDEEAEIVETVNQTLNAGSTLSFQAGDLFDDLEGIFALRIVSSTELVSYEIFENIGERRGYDTLFACSKGMETIYFTHIAPESLYWDTDIAVWNFSENDNMVTMTLYNKSGTELDQVQREIPSGGLLYGEIHEFFDDELISQQCWMKVTGEYSINGYLLFGHKDGGAIAAVEAE